MLKKIILFPFGGNSREALSTILDINAFKKTWKVIGFIDDDQKNYGREFAKVKVLGGRDVLLKYKDAFVLALPGNPSTFLKRAETVESLKIPAKRFPTIIHPSAVISKEAVIGVNTLIMPNVVVSCSSSVGNHCVILPNTTISHDCFIGDLCSLGSNVSVAGYCRIEQKCYIGTGASLRDRVKIGSGTQVGMGSNVVSDIPGGVIAYGNPAKIIRKI
ncbi:MAG: acetyltransferase [Candidatus Omnitrophica bacterium]|nr:acetyltransferase [Candidatus Omnitrophota bacterium]